MPDLRAESPHEIVCSRLYGSDVLYCTVEEPEHVMPPLDIREYRDVDVIEIAEGCEVSVHMSRDRTSTHIMGRNGVECSRRARGLTCGCY